MSMELPIHFLRPFFLLLMIPVAWLLYAVWTHKKSAQKGWSKHIDTHLLDHLIIPGSSSTSKSTWFYSACCAALLSVFALSGPSWEKSPAPVFEKRDALVIVLDLSLSMYATDG
ncbi:MAG: hypothetical protein AAGF06_05395, partial [Pseudomonadota bacterium]